MELSRQKYWSELPFPSLGDLPEPGIKPVSPALASRFLITERPGKPSPFLKHILSKICIQFNVARCSGPGTCDQGLSKTEVVIPVVDSC